MLRDTGDSRPNVLDTSNPFTNPVGAPGFLLEHTLFNAYRDLTDDQNFAIDSVGVASAITTFFGFLPDAVALLTALWALIRLYEMDTVQKMVRWIARKFQTSDEEKSHEGMD